MEKVSRFLERVFIKFTSWMIFFRKETSNGKKAIGLKSPLLWTKGFLSTHPMPYNFNKYKYSDYISDIENIKLGYLNYPYGRIIRDKLVFSNFFNTYFNTPEVYCIINNGKIDPVNLKMNISSEADLLKLIKNKKLVLKPIFGTHGKGVLVIENTGFEQFKLNKDFIKEDELKKIIKTLDQYFVSEFIEQGDFSKHFFENTTNTIRITTFCDPAKPTAFIPYAYMRFGTPKTIPVDNRASGGLISFVDLSTGKLTDAIQVREGKTVYLDNHPDSGMRIKDVEVPEWNKIIDFFRNLGGAIKPFIKVAGWDVVLTNDSFYVIEGNNGPDLVFQGADKPIAKDPDVLRFLKYYKIR